MIDVNSQKIVINFVAAVANSDYQQLENILSCNVINYVTNAEGGVNKVEGAEAYINAIKAMNFPVIKPELNITQILTIKSRQILVMLEVKAKRNSKRLHNHAAFLVNIENEQIVEMSMVEALPAYSDEFWNS